MNSSLYEFVQGYPTESTAQKINRETFLNRALQAYRFFYPTVSMEGTMQGQIEAGAPFNTGALVVAGGPRHVLFTGNSDTPYMGAIFDLQKTGPLVVELPAGPYLGIINDHHFRWIADIGLPGPDAGKGGKHLVVPPDYTGNIPEGYFVSHSKTYKILVGARALPIGGDIQAALVAQRSVKMYPLSQAANPIAIQIADRTNEKIDITCLRWEDNFTYWEKLDKVIQEEPAVEPYRGMYGMLASVGIEKGKQFAPNAEEKKLLEEAARMGRDQMLVSGFASSRPDKIVWKDRKWEWAALRFENGDFELPDGVDLEARERWFSQAVGASPKMFFRSAGAGSLYWLGLRDKNGDFLDGSKTYKLSMPQPVPENLFWSVTVYDNKTRSQIQTDQDKAALRSLFELKDAPKKGTTDLYFGPTAPAGNGQQWIQTLPNRGWFVYLRLYGPEGPAFNGEWKPGDFEQVH